VVGSVWCVCVCVCVEGWGYVSMCVCVRARMPPSTNDHVDVENVKTTSLLTGCWNAMHASPTRTHAHPHNHTRTTQQVRCVGASRCLLGWHCVLELAARDRASLLQHRAQLHHDCCRSVHDGRVWCSHDQRGHCCRPHVLDNACPPRTPRRHCQPPRIYAQQQPRKVSRGHQDPSGHGLCSSVRA
jgi:hypothetical protein